jgi:hypothetical protein
LVACSRFHENSFLLINTQDKLPWVGLCHVIREEECFIPLVMVMSTKRETMILVQIITSHHISTVNLLHSALHIAKELNVDDEKH